MSGMLQVPAKLYERENGTSFEGTFGDCLDAWIALPSEAREKSVITVDGSIPDHAPTWFGSMVPHHIARAVLMRENSEWP